MIAIPEARIRAVYSPADSEPLFIAVSESRIPAGFPSPTDDTKGQIDIAAHLVKRPESTFFMRVSGDSMTGAGIFDGDLLVVDRSLSPESGDIVIAVVNGEFTVKRLSRNRTKIELLPENPRYKKIALTEGSELEIWGVVTNSVKSFK